VAPSEEVNAAVGGAPDLDERIETLERELATPTRREAQATQLADLKRRKAERDAAELQSEAAARLLGIARALGSLADQSRLDNARLLEAARKFGEQVAVLNERFERCIGLRHEASALAAVFDLEMRELPPVVVPALRPEVQEAFEITSRVGVRDNGFVAATTDTDGRRTYEELRDLPGGDLVRRKLGHA